MSPIRIEHLPLGGPWPGGPQPRILALCLEVRRRVFIIGQGIPRERELDGLDFEAEHFLAVEETAAGDRPVGTARLRILAEGAKVERVAVLEEARRRDVGRRLMQSAEARASQCGQPRVMLHAQLQVVPFYEKLGYLAEPGIFDEAGIPHRAMDKQLPHVLRA